jgi:hypothetical protein
MLSYQLSLEDELDLQGCPETVKQTSSCAIFQGYHHDPEGKRCEILVKDSLDDLELISLSPSHYYDFIQ